MLMYLKGGNMKSQVTWRNLHNCWLVTLLNCESASGGEGKFYAQSITLDWAAMNNVNNEGGRSFAQILGVYMD